MDSNLDLAIIGGGIIGACAAWYARKLHPEWKITIFEKSANGTCGATHYSASLDLPYGHTPLRYRLAHRSGLLYAALRKELADLPIKDISFYGIVQESNAWKILTQVTDVHASITPTIIPSLLAKYPNLVLPEQATIISGATATQATRNDVANILVNAFASCEHAALRASTTITNVSFRENCYELSDDSGKITKAKKVIQATGPWMTKSIGIGSTTLSKARIKKIVAFHIPVQPEPTDSLFYFFDDDAFLMPKFEAGYWLFSFKCEHWDVEPDIKALTINDADIQKAKDILRKYYPAFVSLCRDGRVFCDAYTATGDPIIEQAEGYPDYIIAGAGAGSGYRLAPGIAEEALSYLAP